ncbi:hypothetical protein E1B28_012111 [Marasmius oreades]|uniref:CCAAT-binding factor domain-containing protein n=1 Tax=Marasmius oreades TaxID=181124 RepID=A0A9P7RQZ7_9AGAR|nr:uncharacterized protein E1B28_012111 [Marasmius oreades]KAG7088080.1 hypothetical protein E1B28_012111 [Marasmius oreades]
MPNSPPSPAKRRKTSSENSQSIRKLEQQITDIINRNSSLNSLVDLLDLTTATFTAEKCSKSIYALYRSFVMIIRRGKFVIANEENEKIVKTWLQEQMNEYVDVLAGLLKDEEKVSKSIWTFWTCSTIYGLAFTTISGGSFCEKLVTVKEHPYASQNLLSFLEKLTTFPTEPSELNAWWVEEMGKAPPKTKRQKNAGTESEEEEDEALAEDDEDGWRKFFDEPDKDKDKDPQAKSKTKSEGRVHADYPQSLHSLPSHSRVHGWLYSPSCPYRTIRKGRNVWFYNMLKRHPALMPMIHRDGTLGNDQFNASETNPFITKAIESSLWEIQTHNSHYHPSVSTLAKIFSEAFTKQKYGIEDLLHHRYSTLFETEVNRKIKKEPALAMEQDVEEQTRAGLFGNETVEGGGLTGGLWTF